MTAQAWRARSIQPYGRNVMEFRNIAPFAGKVRQHADCHRKISRTKASALREIHFSSFPISRRWYIEKNHA
jgi:hypothetical protein